MQIKNIKRRIITSLVCLFLFAVSLFFTLPGHKFLVWLANQTVSGLVIEQPRARLLSGTPLTLAYHSDGIVVKGRNVRVTLEWFSCATICISLHGEQISIRQNQSASEQLEPELEVEPESKRTSKLLPFSLQLKEIKLNKIKVETPQLALTVNKVDSSVSVSDRQIQIPFLQIASFQAVTFEQQATTVQSPLTELAPITLPNIDVPISLQLRRFVVHQLAINEQQLQNLKFDELNLDETQLALSGINASYQDMQFTANGTVTLSDFGLNLTTQVADKNNTLSAEMAGHLNELHINVATEGQIVSTLQLQADLTQRNWPFDLTTKLHDSQMAINGLSPQSVSVDMRGDASRYHFNMDSMLLLDQIGQAKVKASAAGGLDKLEINHLKMELPDSTFAATGKVAWGEKLTSELQVQFNALPIGKILALAEVEGIPEQDSLSGGTELEFTYQGSEWQLMVNQLSATGDIANKPLTLDAQLSLNDRLQGEVKHSIVRYGNSLIDVQGELGKQLDLMAKVHLAHEHSELIPVDIIGQGELFIRGDYQQPQLQSTVAINRVNTQQLSLTGVNISTSGLLSMQPSGQLSVSIDAIEQGQQQLENIKLKLDGDVAQHRLKLTVRDPLVVGDLSLTGQTTAAGWQATLAQGQFTAKGKTLKLSEPALIEMGANTQSIAPQCWKVETASVCFEVTQKQGQGIAKLNAQHIDLEKLTAWLGGDFFAYGQANTAAEVQWQHGKLLGAKATARLTSAGVSYQQQNLPIEHVALSVTSNQQQVSGNWQLDSSVLGALNGTFQTPLNQANPTLRGNIEIQGIALDKLTPFVEKSLDQELQMGGNISGAMALSGVLNAPELTGELTLQSLALSSPLSPVEVSDGFGKLSVNKQSARFNADIKAKQGGDLQLNGELNWASKLHANLNVTGDALFIQANSNVELTASPNIQVSYRDQLLDVSGKVLVPYGRVNIDSLPEGVVSPSDDQVIIDAKAQEPTQSKIAQRIDLHLIVADNFRVKALGLDSFIHGELEIDKQPDSVLLATGELALREGSYRAFGQDLLIRTGQIGFNGSLEQPYLNIKAIRNPEVTADGVIAGVELAGSIKHPKLNVYSEPAMDQGKALAYLLNGQPFGEGEGSNNALLTQLLLSQGIDRSEGFFSKVGNKLGFSDVNLAAKGSGDDTQVEVSGYITPNVQVSYRVGVFESMNEIALRYRVFSKFYIEATSGLYDSVDLLYKFDWDTD
ncbi:translocation/assembly module TamB domain-containing protein [Pseudoalteromonas sp. T1lg65]|uniref:translocation/assembly module TamB domain-containing protein n=1 Tax=Pseudoalteromonas sp. T1lg65 TaxID=2077101 RepID=UPI003F7AC487